MNLYDKTKQNNILDNDQILSSVLVKFQNAGVRFSANGPTHPGNGGLYNTLISDDIVKDETVFNNDEYTKFNIKRTDKWLQGIKSLTPQEIDYYINNGYPLYKDIYNICIKYDSITTEEQYEKLYEELNSIRIFDYTINYFWRYDQGTSESDFHHIYRNYSDGRRTYGDEAEFRLYFNPSKEHIMEFISEYLDMAEKENVHYYFKFSWTDRIDKILIYSSKKDLEKNIEIIRKIAKNKPYIVNNSKGTMPLVANIDGWFNICSEPNTSVKHSYNTLRAEIFEDAAEQMVIEIIKKYLLKEITYDGKMCEFRDLLLEKVIEYFSNEIINDSQNSITVNDSERLHEYLNRVLLTNYYIKLDPYKSIDGEKVEFESNNRIIMDFFSLVQQIIPYKNRLRNRKFISLPFNEEHYDIYFSDVAKFIKSFLNDIYKTDINYMEIYRECIKKQCKEKNVDYDNFSFNADQTEFLKNIELLEYKTDINIERDNTSDKNNEVTSEELIHMILKEYMDLKIDFILFNRQVENNNIDYQTLYQMIKRHADVLSSISSIKDLIGKQEYENLIDDLNRRYELLSSINPSYENNETQTLS